MRIRRLLLATLIAGGLTFAGAENVLRIGVPVDPINLDPAQMSHMEAHRFVALLYPTLLRYDTDLRLIPHIAESFEIIDDTTYEFRLRDDVLFHNGRPLVAEDVKYSINRILDPDVPSPEAFEVEMVSEVEIIDDHTLRIHTADPVGPTLHGLTFGLGIHPQEAVEEFGDLRFNAVGTGPFQLVSYDPDSTVVFERFDDYFGPTPHLDGVTYFIMVEPMSRVTALRAGDIDVARFEDPKAVIPLQADPNITVAQDAQPRNLHYHLNNRREPFNDPRVRLAMSYAIDRQEIVDLVYLGEASPSGPIPPVMAEWALPVEELEGYEHNPDRARELLAEAGYPDGFSSTITATPRFPIDAEVAQVMREHLARVGIQMEIQMVDWGDMLDMWIERHDYDTLVIGSFTGRDPDANFYRRLHSVSERNAVGYSNPEVDELMELGRTTVDPDERFEIYAELQRIVAREAPKIFVVDSPVYEAYRTDVVHNWVVHPMSIHYHLDQVEITR